MNYYKLLALIFLILFGIMPSCVKNTATTEYTSGNANQNLTSLSPVKKGEPFVISAVLPDSNASVRWTIRPSDSTDLVAQGNQVKILINLAGSYVITANFYSAFNTVIPYDSNIYNIVVKDSAKDSISLPPPPSDYDTLSLAGVELLLSPVSTAGGFLTLLVQTTNVYACTSYISEYGILTDASSPTSVIHFTFNSGIVAESTTDCNGPGKPAFNNSQLMPLEIGLHPFLVSLNQVNYQGTLNVTDSDYTFNWLYSSGVTISPLQIKK